MGLSQFLGRMLVGKNAHITYAIRFIPDSRIRTDLRGRLYDSYLTHTEMSAALRRLHEGGPTKETEDGIYYASVEICTSPFGRKGDSKPKVDPRQIAIPFKGGSEVPQGIPLAAAVGPGVAAAAQAAADDGQGVGQDGGAGGPAAGTHSPAEPAQPVGETIGKVDLSLIGMR